MIALHLPRLILIAGLPGTGKSSIARAYVERYGGIHLNSDLLRNDMGLRGHYTAADKESVYQEMLSQTRQALMRGQTAVVDSTFIKAINRVPFEQLGQSCRVPYFWIEMRTQEEHIRERLKTPRLDSEADFRVYLTLLSQQEPIQTPHLELWSDKMCMDNMLESIHNYTLRTSL